MDEKKLKKYDYLKEEIFCVSSNLQSISNPFLQESIQEDKVLDEYSNILKYLKKLQTKEDQIVEELLLELKKQHPQWFGNPLIQKLENDQHYDKLLWLFRIIERCPDLLTHSNLKILVDFPVSFPFAYKKVAENMMKYSVNFLLDPHLPDFLDDENILYTCRYSSFFKEDFLMQDEAFKNILLSFFNNNTISNLNYPIWYLEDQKNILWKNPQFNRELLLYCTNSQDDNLRPYLLQNIDQKEILQSLLSIEDLDFIHSNLLKKIIQEYHKLQKLAGNASDHMKTAVLLVCQSQHIIDFYEEEILWEEETRDKFSLPIVKNAMLAASSVLNQTILAMFLIEEEIVKELCNHPESIYYDFLLMRTGKTDINYGTLDNLFNGLPLPNDKEEQKQYLLHLFDHVGLTNIYFVDCQKQLQKVSIAFYRQFMENTLNGAYIKQCYDLVNTANNLSFQNWEIITAYLDEDYVKMAKAVIEMGIGTSPDYNLETEIIWNYLFYQIGDFDENKQYEKRQN